MSESSKWTGIKHLRKAVERFVEEPLQQQRFSRLHCCTRKCRNPEWFGTQKAYQREVQERLRQFLDEQLSLLPGHLLVRMQALKDVEDDLVLPELLHPGLR